LSRYKQISSENRRFCSSVGQFDPKCQIEGGVPQQPFYVSENYMNLSFMWYKNLGGTFVSFVTFHACDGQTDRQTDRHLCRKKDRMHTAAR